MSPITATIQLFLLPPGVFVWLGLLAMWWAYRGRIRRATVLAVMTLSALYLLSTPKGAYWVSEPLERRVQPLTHLPLLAKSQDALVVLGGGRLEQATEYGRQDVVSAQVLERLRYAAHWHRQTGLPILVTGGKREDQAQSEAELMAQSLQGDFRVPVRWQETVSRNTAENAKQSAVLLLPLGVKRVVLVSHASHLPRAVKQFEQTGFSVLPAPTAFTDEALTCRPMRCWTPQGTSLMESCRALHEWLGLWRDTVSHDVFMN